MARIPGSKSGTLRGLMLGAMHPGVTEVTGGLHCDDSEQLRRALDAFGGLLADQTSDGFRVTREADELHAPSEALQLGVAGTPARFLLGFSAQVTGETTLTGDERLCERPMGGLLHALREIGVRFQELGHPDHLPVRISGGAPTSDTWHVNAEVSSQFTSSLLLLAAQQGRPIALHVHGPQPSRAYVDLTLQMLKQAGIPASGTPPDRGPCVLQVSPPARLPALSRVVVEADASSMTPFLAAAAITGSCLSVPNIGHTSRQADVAFASALQRMGCSLGIGPHSLRIQGAPLRGIEIDMSQMPDAVLNLAVVAACADGPTHITGVGNLRFKECDRLHAAATELNRLGVEARAEPDALLIRPTSAARSRDPLTASTNTVVRTYDDHRVAMAFAVVGLVVDGLQIEDPACVSKSFPMFWKELARFRQHHGAEPPPV